MPILSAFLIVKNEINDLPGCLESLKGLADEIIVVDDESTDGTPELAKQWRAKVFSRKLDGFASQKQYALDQCTGDWALSIDADERVMPELAKEIKATMAQNGPAAGYYLRRQFYFLGHRLKYGGVGQDWVLRFFRRDKGLFHAQEIHERIVVNGPTAKLLGPLDHYSYGTLEEYLQKLPLYTAYSAKKWWNEGRRFNGIHYFRPVWELFSRIILKGAWLDGQPGLLYATLCSHAAWLKSVKLWEMEHSKKSS